MRSKPQGRLTRWLETTSPAMFSCYAIFAAFWTYFCMYAFRKPFAVATFEGYEFSLFEISIDLKTAIIIGQILGYTLSKFIGIKVCSEITRKQRAVALVSFILFAQFTWILYAVVPDGWKIFAAFLNGLPLGMIWGLVVWYLEGRKTSELLLAGLSCSFILASGMVKSVGAAILNSQWIRSVAASILGSQATIDIHFMEAWMPALTGFVFLPGYLIAVWMLNQIPNPTKEDERLRVHRQPMNRAERLIFIKQFFVGLILIFTVYFFLTAYREFRDDFASNLFIEMGYVGNDGKSAQPVLFTKTELPIAFGVLIALAALNLIKNNRLGLLGAYCVMISGVIILGVSTILFHHNMIEGDLWMVFNGLGVYLAYVPYGSVFFDRLIASTKSVGTAVFAIYIADALGYVGAVAILLFKKFGNPELSYLEFFRNFSYFMSLLGAALLILSYFYFRKKHHSGEPPE